MSSSFSGTLQAAQDRLERLQQRFVEIFRHGTLSIELYAPRRHDPQHPHDQDELYVVARGRGQFVNGSERHPFAAGDALFVPAGVEHRFEDFGNDLAVWVVFWGPAGGEHDDTAARPPYRWRARDTLERIPVTAELRSVPVFTHATLTLKLYAPRGHDPQTPHRQDEVYIVHSGNGRFQCDGETHAFAPGDVLFARAGAAHRFEDFSDDLALWVVFYGPPGGEAAV